MKNTSKNAQRVEKSITTIFNIRTPKVIAKLTAALLVEYLFSYRRGEENNYDQIDRA